MDPLSIGLRAGLAGAKEQRERNVAKAAVKQLAKKEKASKKALSKQVARAVSSTADVGSAVAGAKVASQTANRMINEVALQRGVPIQVRAMAASLAMPMEEVSYHLGDPAQAVPSAIAKTFERWDIEACPYTDARLEQGSGFAIVRKSALGFCQKSVFSPGPTAAVSPVYFRLNPGQTVPSTQCSRKHGVNGSLPLLFKLPGGEAGAIGVPRQFAATINGDQSTDRYIWFDEGTVKLNALVAGAGASDICNVTWEMLKFDSKQSQSYNTQTQSKTGNGSATQLVLSVTNGYYAFRANVTMLTTGGLASAGEVSLSITEENLSQKMQIVTLPVHNIEKFAGAVDALRVNSASCLWTNTTPMINRGGEIAGFQPAPGQSPLHVLMDEGEFANSPFEVLSTQAGSVTLDATNGQFGYVKPAGVSEFYKFEDEFSTGASGEITDSYYPLVDDKPCIIHAWKIPFNETVEFTGIMTTCAVTEFLTDEQWLERRYADFDPSVVESAVQLLSEMPCFMENPLHIAMLDNALAGLKDFGKNVYKTVRGGLKGVRALNKDARRTMKEVSPVLSSFVERLLG